jgi:hypothetical protein
VALEVTESAHQQHRDTQSVVSVVISTSPLIQIGEIAHPTDRVMCNSGDGILSARDHIYG